MANLFWPFGLSTITEWCGTDRGGGVVHMGTDFGVPQGTPLKATISGTITRHNNDGLGAYVLDIMRADGLLVRNAHLSRMDVNTGDYVEAGQVIGLTGGARGVAGSGNSTGPHLHWELRWDRLWQKGSWVDPRTLAVGNFGDAVTPAAPLSALGDHIAAEGADWTYWVPSTQDQATVQAGLTLAGTYSGPIDGNLTSDASVRAIQLVTGNHGFFDLNHFDGQMNKNLCHAILLMAQTHGGYEGRMDWQIDGHVWAAFDGAIRATAPAPVPAPAPVSIDAPVVAPEAAVTPVVVVKPKPVIISKPKPVIAPKKEYKMTEEESAKQAAQIAALPASDLGAIITSPKHRVVAYAIFALLAMTIGNTAVGFASLQLPFPPWLVVATALVNNLAVPFAALAVANAKTVKVTS